MDFFIYVCHDNIFLDKKANMIKWLKNLFKKNNTKVLISKPKLDLRNIKFNLNIKSICYFEKLVGISFYDFEEIYLLELMYSIFHINNPDMKISFEAFKLLMERDDVAEYFLKDFTNISKMIQQISEEKKEIKNTNSDKQEGINKTITDYITTLIIEYGMDPHYVYYEMEMWELYHYFEAIDTKIKRDLINRRFWTYLQIMPHIDSKKCKTPEDLISFEWEKETIKKKKENDLKNNVYAFKNMIGKSIFGNKEKENG